ncbi:hypothetical protein GCM10010435_77770 [Winogradskya consettensis]|uniref:Nucleotidyltransferase AbiEii toxin of type IV toxin-antitoxin system n=1 Tax=Winogradskya consettensis TaxID=113560 RepID=A0A919VZM4_9ACTN|nr:nucleotidyl transferase AbiEii/AbiGii toxin family protein [Actinoplanes consettensis]GIM74773.1 hypothetical protein Aco04nite_41980 [Actinoplanes consettensis]
MDGTTPGQRAALDHVLAVVDGSWLAGVLVLRGSVTMPAWVGDRARPPGDIDWMVRPMEFVSRDDLDPYPYVSKVDPVRHWPEVAHGVRCEIWESEDLDTGGHRPRVPPEGLRWISDTDADGYELSRPHNALLEQLTSRPETGDGVRLHPDKAERDGSWGYTEYAEGSGVRIHIPWQSRSGESGSVQVDFAYDERLPEPPVLTAVPRAAGQRPLGLWTASRELSLAWKLHWLHADQAATGSSAAKDLYDAVQLAEIQGIRLPCSLRRTLTVTPDDILTWTIAGGGGDAGPLLVRLAEAVRSMSAR